MSKHLSDILKEADELIEKRASEGISKTASAKTAAAGDDVFAMAQALVRGPAPSAEMPQSSVATLVEKIAHAAAVVDTLRNLPALMKLAEFEEAARKAGYSEAQIGDFIEKRAGVFKIESVFEQMPWVGASAR